MTKWTVTTPKNQNAAAGRGYPDVRPPGVLPWGRGLQWQKAVPQSTTGRPGEESTHTAQATAACRAQ